MSPQAKEEIRKTLRSWRKSLAKEVIVEKSNLIATEVIRLIELNAPRSIHCYQAIEEMNEVQTTNIIEYCKNNPKVTLTVGTDSPFASLPPAQYDMIIVPVLGFNDDHHRIGYGGGWYDRFLATQVHAFTIGLAYTDSKTHFQPEPHDVPLDMILEA